MSTLRSKAERIFFTLLHQKIEEVLQDYIGISSRLLIKRYKEAHPSAKVNVEAINNMSTISELDEVCQMAEFSVLDIISLNPLGFELREVPAFMRKSNQEISEKAKLRGQYEIVQKRANRDKGLNKQTNRWK